MSASLTVPEKTNILLVDDRPEKLLALEAVLADLNQNMVKATSGEEALRLLLRRDFAAILLDVHMPGLNGFETAALIRQRHRSEHTPILFITGINTTETHVHKGYSLGAVDYIFTPVVPEILRAKVAVFVDLYMKTEEVKRQAEQLRQIEEERHQRNLLEATERLEAETKRNRFFLLSIDLLGIAGFDGYFKQLNPSWQKVFGFSESELKSKYWIEFVHPQDREGTNQQIKNLMTTEAPVSFENRFLALDGSYRWLAWTVAPFHAEKLLYLFARDVTERKKVEEKLRHYTEELEKAQEASLNILEDLEAEVRERKLAEREILEISGREQRRLGQDLHDGLGQILTGIAFMSKVLSKQLAEKSLPEADQAGKIADLVNDAIQKTRDLARGFHPVELEANGLGSALQELAAHMEDLFKVACVVDCPRNIEVRDLNKATQVYRIVQEAVKNAVNHGKARHISISLKADRDKTILTVTDDGIGIPDVIRKKKGMGLHIMKYRAGMIHGALEIKRQPIRGTRVQCAFPSASDKPST